MERKKSQNYHQIIHLSHPWCRLALVFVFIRAEDKSDLWSYQFAIFLWFYMNVLAQYAFYAENKDNNLNYLSLPQMFVCFELFS